MALLHVKLRKVFWKGGDEVENWIGREKYTVEDLLEIVALLRDPERAAHGIRCKRMSPSVKILLKKRMK